jgi:hypothetical protein
MGLGTMPPVIVIALPARHGILSRDVFQALIAPLSGSMEQVYTRRETVIDIFLMAFIIAARRGKYMRKSMTITLEFLIVIANRVAKISV